MWKVVSLAAISVSADLLELWFLGDLLGIFWFSEAVFFFLIGFGFGVLWSLACGFGVLWSLACGFGLFSIFGL